jgi:hypothetical protein
MERKPTDVIIKTLERAAARLIWIGIQSFGVIGRASKMKDCMHLIEFEFYIKLTNFG